MIRVSHFMRLGALVAALVFVAGIARAQESFSPAPASPQPAESELQPGLAVEYHIKKLNSIAELEEWSQINKPSPGEPIMALNYNVQHGEVLTSGHTDLVGAIITGFIKFDQAGTWLVAVNSNDGVQINIGGQKVLEDPDVHADRMTDPVALEITTPGWYPLLVEYFEKKNTSTLEFYWQPPGGDVEMVPASAYAHIPEG
jgi:hypothetical protein